MPAIRSEGIAPNIPMARLQKHMIAGEECTAAQIRVGCLHGHEGQPKHEHGHVPLNTSMGVFCVPFHTSVGVFPFTQLWVYSPSHKHGCVPLHTSMGVFPFTQAWVCSPSHKHECVPLHTSMSVFPFTQA
eukprot:366002-Chlamydomonas_euryale.AAC.7